MRLLFIVSFIVAQKKEKHNIFGGKYCVLNARGALNVFLFGAMTFASFTMGATDTLVPALFGYDNISRGTCDDENDDHQGNDFTELHTHSPF